MPKKKEGLESATVRRTLRFTPTQVDVVDAAISTSVDAWRGFNHHARQAILHWARGVLAQRRAARHG